MGIREGFVILVAGLLGLAGCSSSVLFGDAVATEKLAAYTAPNPDITGSIGVPPPSQSSAPAQAPPQPDALSYVLLGAAY